MDLITPSFPFLMFPLGAPPSISNVTSVGTGGGSATVGGANFAATPTASALINGVATALTVTFVSASTLTVVLPSGTYTAGNWNLTITNPNGQTTTAPGAFQVTTIANPQTIFGANLIAQWIASAATVSGSAVSSVPDNTGNGNTLSSGSGTQVTNDTRFFMNPTTILMNGTSDYLLCSSFNTQASSTLYVIGAACVVSNKTNGIFTDYSASGSELLIYVNTSNELVANANVGGGTSVAGPATAVPNVVADPVIFNFGYVTTGSAVNGSIQLNNGTEYDGTFASTTSLASGGTFAIGGRYTSGSPSQYQNFAWPEVFVTDVKPTSSQMLQVAEYFNSKYGVTAPPVLTTMTPVSAGSTNVPARISGTGFMSGVTVSISDGTTVTACTVTSSTSVSISFTIPISLTAGTSYDVIINNVDGRSRTFINAFTATSATSPWSIFGSSIVGWYEDVVTVSGSVVTSWFDKSCAGNSGVPTGSPTYTSSDSSFNSHPSVALDGATQCFQLGSGVINLNGGTALACLAVVVQTTTSTANQYFFAPGLNAAECPFSFDNGKPELSYGNGVKTITYGTALSGTKNVYWSVASGGTPLLTVNVSNGTAVSANTTSGALNPSTTAPSYLGARFGSSQWTDVKMGCVLILNAVPTSGQLAAWESYAQTTYGAT